MNSIQRGGCWALVVMACACASDPADPQATATDSGSPDSAATADAGAGTDGADAEPTFAGKLGDPCDIKDDCAALASDLSPLGDNLLPQCMGSHIWDENRCTVHCGVGGNDEDGNTEASKACEALGGHCDGYSLTSLCALGPDEGTTGPGPFWTECQSSSSPSSCDTICGAMGRTCSDVAMGPNCFALGYSTDLCEYPLFEVAQMSQQSEDQVQFARCECY